MIVSFDTLDWMKTQNHTRFWALDHISFSTSQAPRSMYSYGPPRAEKGGR